MGALGAISMVNYHIGAGRMAEQNILTRLAPSAETLCQLLCFETY